jgi:hypothetical protein
MTSHDLKDFAIHWFIIINHIESPTNSISLFTLLKQSFNMQFYEAAFYPSTPSSMKCLYLKIYKLLMKKKGTNVFLDVKLHL